jgi:hypothetical protein
MRSEPALWVHAGDMRTWSGGCGSEYHWAATEIERAALRARPENSLTGEHPEVDSKMLLVIGARVQKIQRHLQDQVCVHSSSYDQPQYSTPKRLHRHFSNLQANAYQTAPFSAVNQAHR